MGFYKNGSRTFRACCRDAARQLFDCGNSSVGHIILTGTFDASESDFLLVDLTDPRSDFFLPDVIGELARDPPSLEQLLQ